MTDIKSMTIDELKKLMTTLGDKPFRDDQSFQKPEGKTERIPCHSTEDGRCTDIPD